MIDYTADGRAIGIEITSPGRVSVERINRALATAKHQPIAAADFFPSWPLDRDIVARH
jgi:hypothetical protein